MIFKIWLCYIWVLRWLGWSSSFLWFLFCISRFALLEKIILFNIIFILKLRLIMEVLLLRIGSGLLMNIFSRSRIRFIVNNFFNWTSRICFLQNILVHLDRFLFFFKVIYLLFLNLFQRSLFIWFLYFLRLNILKLHYYTSLFIYLFNLIILRIYFY